MFRVVQRYFDDFSGEAETGERFLSPKLPVRGWFRWPPRGRRERTVQTLCSASRLAFVDRPTPRVSFPNGSFRRASISKGDLAALLYSSAPGLLYRHLAPRNGDSRTKKVTESEEATTIRLCASTGRRSTRVKTSPAATGLPSPIMLPLLPRAHPRFPSLSRLPLLPSSSRRFAPRLSTSAVYFAGDTLRPVSYLSPRTLQLRSRVSSPPPVTTTVLSVLEFSLWRELSGSNDNPGSFHSRQVDRPQ